MSVNGVLKYCSISNNSTENLFNPVNAGHKQNDVLTLRCLKSKERPEIIKRIIYFFISSVIVIIDQYTKYLIINNIMAHEAIDILPFFNIVNVANKGAAFGSFQKLGNPFFIVVSFIAIAIVIFLMIKEKENPLALSFILGGAFGNLIDRMRHGFVVDFLDFFAGKYHWPAFNVADSFLSIGVILILITYILSARKKSRKTE